MTMRWTILFALLCVTTVVTIPAHHSMSQEFDVNRHVTATGVITKVDWANPHIWIYLDMQTPTRRDIGWGIQSAPPGGLKAKGVTASSLPIGTRVTVEGFPSLRPGVRTLSGISLTLPDGKLLDIRDTWPTTGTQRKPN